jgi:hypothetical protein
MSNSGLTIKTYIYFFNYNFSTSYHIVNLFNIYLFSKNHKMFSQMYGFKK